MKIGLDFDGVITDCSKLKEAGARVLFRKYIPAEIFKKEIVIGNKLLTPLQYRTLQEKIYSSFFLGLKMEPVSGMKEYLTKIIKKGHDIKIITSRYDKSLDIAKIWMDQHCINIPITGVGYGKSKAEACKNLEVYVDDDVEKLEDLVDVVEHRYLFTWDSNTNIHIDQKIGRRVYSWKGLYDNISRLSRNNK